MAVPQLGSCASSGRAWRLWAARHSQEEAGPLGAQLLPWVLELATCRAANSTAFGHSGEDVGNWLDKLGLGEHAKSFEHHRIVGDMVHSLTESHLKELGVNFIGQRMTILRDASRIRRHSANKVRSVLRYP